MPDLPALPLGSPVVGSRSTRRSPRPRLEGPGGAAQEQRLGPKLQRLTDAFETGRLATIADPAAVPSEQILVLEVAGELGTFARAVRKIQGLEFLADEAEDKLEPDDDFAAVDRQGRRHGYSRQLFLVASDAVAWQQLLGLWQQYKAGATFRRGFTPFRDLFARLRDVRAWDDRDRLERTGALEAWQADFAALDGELVEFEAELWLRTDEERREAAVARLRTDLQVLGGSIVSQKVMPEIGYHGVLGRVPARCLHEAVAGHEVRWMSTNAVRFFHAVGQVATPDGGDTEDAQETHEARGAPSRLLPSGTPRVAVLDGVPLAGHAALAGRVVVDDPDGWEATTTAAQRVHGTGMASIVIHGDLNANGPAQSRPIYVRPILAPGPDWVRSAPEELPRDRLAVDLIHAAVARLFVGDAPAAPEVKVVVLAVGDKVQQFDRFVSPLARLVDWLSFEYGVLFLVAAGNHLTALDVRGDVGLTDPQELQHEVLCALQRSASLRRLLSPAESANAVTIGAAHADAAAAHTDDRLEPMVTGDLPNLTSAFGSGIRRAVKPDILFPGGRQLVRLEPAGDNGRRPVTAPVTTRPPGVCMAAPGRSAGDLDTTVHATGTSVATALGGHHAGLLLDQIDELRERHRDKLPTGLAEVLVKAALAHTARWGTAEVFIDQALEDVLGKRSRDAVGRLVGYGQARPDAALRCDDHRVTALAAARIEAGQAHTYRFPLPASLASQAALRRLTLTLAWLTPINHEHRAYRRAALSMEPAGVKLVEERMDVDFYGSRRGTVQHNVLEGDRAVPYAPGSAIEVVVSCRADAGTLEVAVPYGLIATLEVPAVIGLPIYDEVREALLVPAPVPVRATAARA